MDLSVKRDVGECAVGSGGTPTSEKRFSLLTVNEKDVAARSMNKHTRKQSEAASGFWTKRRDCFDPFSSGVLEESKKSIDRSREAYVGFRTMPPWEDIHQIREAITKKIEPLGSFGPWAGGAQKNTYNSLVQPHSADFETKSTIANVS
ncbi:hypothetical protein BS47DRAFT_1359339 [Hydnum rufescens UP504]|uniref:Uncharacterized protein n=1 Tax=Hydnum rufescens UP504 TaxID=1448309 RepID=A0A9P6B4Z0_9AGAM|nr:hypothetical protein BS47DRAFT_1359339 [Hydnum rufescens UP504]